MKKNLLIIATAFYIQICNAQLLFNESAQTLESSGYNFSIGDLNNDGFPDLYISTQNDPTGKSGNIWLNNGQGFFTKGQAIGIKGMTQRVAFADLNNDDNLDIFLTNDATYLANPDSAYLVGCPNEVWFNDGNGNFTNSGQLLGFEPSLNAKLADVDNDGDIDAVVSNYHDAIEPYLNYKPDEVWLNNGSGVFSLSQTLGYGIILASLSDLNHDNYIDIIDKDTLWFNDGNGNFTKSSKRIGTSGRHTIEPGDLDNDGDVDVFVGKWNVPAQIWLNDGSDNFNSSGQNLGNMQCENIQLIDIDSDGDLDAFTDNYGGPCKLWINQGGKQNGQTGKFNDSGLNLPTGRGILCDLNKDGKQDAIIGNKVWINEYVETSVNEINDNNKVIISPNPTSGAFTILIGTTPVDDALVTIYNLQGAQVFSKTFQNAQSATIDLTGNSAGIYVVKVIADGVYEEKILKE